MTTPTPTALEALRELISATDEYNECVGGTLPHEVLVGQIAARTERYFVAWMG